VRDKIYLVSFLLGAGVLLFLGRDLLPASVLVTWGLTFGGTTSVGILLVVLYRFRLELQASRHELGRKEAELNFALGVQKALFPRHFPTNAGLEFAAVCIPARGVSGDYYDVLQLPDGRLIFVIADISGKGIPAAILMANLQALLRALATIGNSPTDVCGRLNRHLNQVMDDSTFATFFYAEWHPGERQLRYVNAGHNPPILLNSRPPRRLKEGGIPLGVFPSYEFEMGEVRLKPSDLLVLYSDGVTEAGENNGEEFGEQRLENLITANHKKPLTEIQTQVLEAVRKWSGPEVEDDMTLVLVRAKGD
jgi:sigma-B regulation protein RsbU (phosphoserine phosphatase)